MDELPLDLAVRHAVRVRGLATTDEIVSAVDRPAQDVEAKLAALSAAGEVIERSGRVNGWALTAAGRSAHARQLDAARPTWTGLDALAGDYEQFEPLNAAFKAVCTDWQIRIVDGEAQPNQHDDAEHDAAVLRSVARLHPAAVALAGRMADVTPRFADYGHRLVEAKQRLDAGDPGVLLAPMSGSYHDVWMQWHEDLLLVLGRTRGAADA